LAKLIENSVEVVSGFVVVVAAAVELEVVVCQCVAVALVAALYSFQEAEAFVGMLFLFQHSAF